MTSLKRQLKINKMFNSKKVADLPEDCKDIEEEILQLEQILKEKHQDLFLLQRNLYKQKISSPKKQVETFNNPHAIILNTSVEALKRDIELVSMLSGVEVQSYKANDHCCIVYHVQCASEYEVKHGLRINLKSDVHEIEKISMPVGFNINAVVEEFGHLMKPDCLGAIQNALIAYYERQEQFEALKELLVTEARLFKIIDGTHIEVSFVVQNDSSDDEETQTQLLLMLDYTVYGIRPKNVTFKEQDLPEGAAEIIRQQCVVFKRKPLARAFKRAFLEPYGAGRYKLVPQVLQSLDSPPSRRQPAPAPAHPRHDDTFQPEEDSPSDDE